VASRSQHPLVGFGTYKIGFVPASSNTAGEWIHAQAQAHAHTKTYLRTCARNTSLKNLCICVGMLPDQPGHAPDQDPKEIIKDAIATGYR